MAKIIKKEGRGAGRPAPRSGSRVIKADVSGSRSGVLKADAVSESTGKRKLIKAQQLAVEDATEKVDRKLAAEQAEIAAMEAELERDLAADAEVGGEHLDEAEELDEVDETGGDDDDDAELGADDDGGENETGFEDLESPPAAAALPREGSAVHRNVAAEAEAEARVQPKWPSARDGSEAKNTARAIVEKAHHAATALAQAVEAEVAQSITQARQQGHADGLAQTHDLEEKVAHLSEGLLREVEAQAVEASIKIARSLIQAELDAHPESIVSVVRQALSSSRQQREVNIRVNPVHAETLKDNKRELVDVLGRAKDVDVREDADLEPGGCMVETEIGTIDARLETQFEALVRQLTGGS